MGGIGSGRPKGSKDKKKRKKGSGRPKGSKDKKKRRRKAARATQARKPVPKGAGKRKPKWRWKNGDRLVPVRDYLFSEGDMDYYHVGSGKVSGVWHSEWGDVEYILEKRLFYGEEEERVHDEIMEHARQRIKELRKQRNYARRMEKRNAEREREKDN